MDSETIDQRVSKRLTEHRASESVVSVLQPKRPLISAVSDALFRTEMER